MPAHHEWNTRAWIMAAGCLLALMTGLPLIAAAPDITLRADAGIGGVTKPGRWTPVRISLQSAGAGVNGTLVVAWGAASLRRPVEIAAGATQHFEVYLQTMEVGESVSVRVLSGGQEVAAVSAPVRTLRADEPFAVCVAGSASVAEACAASPAPETLPRSPRGYDAADRLIWDGGDETALTSDQRGALARWRALRALDVAGHLAATDRPRSIMPALARKNRSGTSLRTGMGIYVAVLFTAALLASVRRFRAPAALAGIAALIIAGTAAALAAGRAGSDAVVTLHHATLVQQLAGARGAIVTMQGALEYPTFDSFTVRALIADGAFEAASTAGASSNTALDESGYPIITGTFGLGGRQPFVLYGVSELQPLSVMRRGDAVVVTNVSQGDLTDCRFGDGVLANGSGVLRAGETASAGISASHTGPVITCSLPEPPVTFSEAGRRVLTAGRATLAAYASPADEGAQ